MKTNKKRKLISIVIVLIIVEMCSLILMYYSFLNKSPLGMKNSKSEFNSEMFVMFIQQEDGSYKEKTDDAWPKNYKYNESLSGCVDIDGKVLNGVLTFDEDTGVASVSASETTYCYLYFDIDIRTAFAIYSETDNSLNFYKRSEVPEVGDTFNGLLVSDIFTGLENSNYGSSSPWEDAGYGEVIESIKIVDKISPVNTRRWFEELYIIDTIDVTNLDTSNVTVMDSMFYETHNFDGDFVTVIGLDSWDVSNVESMHSMFGLADLDFNWDLSSWNTSNVKDMSVMFGEAASTIDTEITLNLTWSTHNVTNMSHMFSGFGTNLKELQIIGIENWHVDSAENMSYMFYNAAPEADWFIDLRYWQVGDNTLHDKFNEGCEDKVNPPMAW